MSDTVSVSSISSVCFQKTDFYLYLFLLICIFAYFIYIITKHKENNIISGLTQNELVNKVNELQDNLYECKLHQIQQQQVQVQKLQQEQQIISQQQREPTRNRFLEKIYNPLEPPENIYPSGTFYSRGYNGYQDYQMLGYLSGSGMQLPVFGRYKYPGKTDRFEYYTINDSRNKIKIPFKTVNYNEMYDGDKIDIPELGSDFSFHKYEDQGLRYDPNIF